MLPILSRPTTDRPTRPIIVPITESLTTPFTKLLGPILKFLETLLADTGTNIDQASLKILKLNGSNLIHRHVEEGFA